MARQGLEQHDNSTEVSNCQLTVYESRYNRTGGQSILEVGQKENADIWSDPNPPICEGSALVLTRFYNKSKELERTELKINSTYIRHALRKIVQKYPGVHLHTDPIIIHGVPKCIFHYRKELDGYGRGLQDPVEASHTRLLIRYMQMDLESSIRKYHTYMESTIEQAGLEWENLWMAFRPGVLAYQQTEDFSTTHRVSRVKDMYRCECNQKKCPRNYWVVNTVIMIFDGENFGFKELTNHIHRYDGYTPLHKLRKFPLEYHPENKTIRNFTAKRGKQYTSLLKSHYKQYNGPAQALPSSSVYPWLRQKVMVSFYKDWQASSSRR